MPIMSDSDYCHGMPIIEGHRIWVSHVIANVEEMGINGYAEDFDLSVLDILDTINYCREEKCLKNCLSYCQECGKDKKEYPNHKDLSKVAEKIYQEYLNSF